MYNTTKPYVDKILKMIRSTWKTKWCTVWDDVYPVIEMIHNYQQIDHTDGIGTKGYYHWQQRTFKEAAIDAFAMNANDLAMVGAFDLCKLQNHIFLPKDDNEAIYQIIEKLVELSKKYDIAMTGGETSIHMNMNGMDISITMTGLTHPAFQPIFPRKGNMYEVGDILVGLPSSGLHSNGFTLVHKVLGGFRPEYVEPTRIYVEEIRQLYSSVGAINHITGGAYTKLKPFLPKNVDAEFRFENKPAKIFFDLFKAGVKSETMYKTFNCGYGFVLGVPEENLDHVLKHGGEILGNVVSGTGRVYIKSAFDGEIIIY